MGGFHPLAAVKDAAMNVRAHFFESLLSIPWVCAQRGCWTLLLPRHLGAAVRPPLAAHEGSHFAALANTELTIFGTDHPNGCKEVGEHFF